MSMSIQDLKEKHPNIAFWMDALEQSEKDTSGNGKDLYAFVKSFYHSGTWQVLPTTPVKSKNFEKSLKSVLEKSPDAIKIIFCESPGGTKGKREFEVKISGKEIIEPEKGESAMLGELNDMKQTLAEIKKMPALKPDNTPNTDVLVMQKEFEHKMTMLEVNSRHRDEINQKNRTIEKLEEKIEELESEIEEYENDLKMGESQLGDLQQKLESKEEKESSLQFLITKSLEKAGKNLLTTHTATAGALLGVDEKIIKEALAKDERFQKEIENKTSESESSTSFSEAKNREPEHQKGYEEMVKLFDELPIEQFKYVYHLMSKIQNPDGSINTELTAKLIGMAQNSEAN